MDCRVLIGGLLLWSALALAGPVERPTPVADTGIGKAIYRTGHLPDGKPIRAQREPAMSISGSTAACMNCHKRSGLGAREGQTAIPPIAGIYLFHPRAGTVDNLDLPFVEGMKPDRDPYTEASLARAIREGIAADGKPLFYLMPHFALDDAQMTALVAYLRQLSPTQMPGVDNTTLHFATIVTPEADPAVKQGVLDVLTRFFDDKNHYTRSQGPRMQSSHRMMFKVNRHWQLHVWELSGSSSGWEAQLRARLAAQPVFAVIGSTGGSHWEPVHRFCEAAELPCLFPVIDAPVNDPNDFDNVYFSGGVRLEAALMAHDLLGRGALRAGTRIIQVYRAGDVGEEAAPALRHDLPATVHVVEQRMSAGTGKTGLHAALAEARPGDVLVLWLRSADLAELGPVPPGVRVVYLSARMGGLEDAPLPADWRALARMAYPFDLPDRRRVQVDYPLGWFRLRGIPVRAQQAQADAYLGCVILSDTLNHMVDTFVRDYLVERIEATLGHRVLTGYYPRLSLAPGQRFASKGGYLVHFSGLQGDRIVADTDWISP